GRGAALLPADARHRPGGGPPAADLRLRQRRTRPHPDRPAAGAAGEDAPGRGGAMNSPRTLPAAPGQKLAAPAFDVGRIREDFPILRQQVHGRPLVYLDNAATTQKPRPVLDAVQRFYAMECANVHRAVHLLSERATHDYEEARGKVQRFLNAAEAREI